MRNDWDQYPYEGFGDMWPRTETTPSWFGVGHKHLLMESHPVQQIIYHGQGIASLIRVHPADEQMPVEQEILRQLGAIHDPGDVARYSTQPYSYSPAGLRGPGDDIPPQFVLPDTRPVRHDALPGARSTDEPRGFFRSFFGRPRR